MQDIEAFLSCSPIEWVKLEHFLQNYQEVSVILAIFVTAILQNRFEGPEFILQFKLFIVVNAQFFEVVDCGGICDEAGILHCQDWQPLDDLDNLVLGADLFRLAVLGAQREATVAAEQASLPDVVVLIHEWLAAHEHV